MDEKFKSLIRSSNLFSSLTPEECDDVARHFTVVHLEKDALLFRQGDTSDYLYILAEGLLAAHLKMPSGEEKIVGHIKVGETVGELGIFSRQPRTLTVKAISDTLLFRLSQKAFEQCYRKYPSILFHLLQPVVTRSQKTIELLSQDNPHSKHILIMPVTPQVPFSALQTMLKKHIASCPDTMMLIEDELDAGLAKNNAPKWIDYLDKLDHDYTTIICLAKSYQSPLLQAFLEKVDQIYFVANGNSRPEYHPFVDQILNNPPAHIKKNHILIHLHDDSHQPVYTLPWLSNQQFAFHHHIRHYHDEDAQRLLRFITGKTTGIVLGGGGNRGWSHVGVIKALLEARVPIDMVGGTSIGGIAGACWLTSQTYDELFEKFCRTMEMAYHPFRLTNFTWPVISVLSSKKITDAFIEAVGKHQCIEDLWIPFFCVSSNLYLKKEAVHTQGLLWESVRASGSIPGIVPPMVIDGQIHVDGGLLNNLPVDVMRNFLGKHSRIIAVKLSSQSEEDIRYSFPPVLTFTETLLTQLGLKKKKYKFPPFFDMFIESLLLGSYWREIQCSAQADLLIDIKATGIKLLQVNPSNIHQLIDLGYQTAMAALEAGEGQV
jgi:NTE family protein